MTSWRWLTIKHRYLGNINGRNILLYYIQVVLEVQKVNTTIMQNKHLKITKNYKITSPRWQNELTNSIING